MTATWLHAKLARARAVELTYDSGVLGGGMAQTPYPRRCGEGHEIRPEDEWMAHGRMLACGCPDADVGGGSTGANLATARSMGASPTADVSAESSGEPQPDNGATVPPAGREGGVGDGQTSASPSPEEEWPWPPRNKYRPRWAGMRVEMGR